MHICNLQADMQGLRRILAPHKAGSLTEVGGFPSTTLYSMPRRDWRGARIGIFEHMDLDITVSHAPVSSDFNLHPLFAPRQAS